MLRQHLARLVTSAVESLVQAGALPAGVREAQVEIIDTKQPEHGDYACNFAMVATKRAGMPPRQIGELLQSELLSDEAFEAIELAGPGFINFRLKPEFIAAYIPRILNLGDDIAKPRDSSIEPKRLNVEFVSVNPNGPITVGSGRGAAFGDTLCRVLEAAGHTINREYYINDGVNSTQMMEFTKSLWRHFLFFSELEDSLEGAQYKGEYMKRLQARLPVASPEVVARIQEFHRENPEASPLEILETGITECFKQWHHLSDKDELTEDELRLTENLSTLVNSAFEHEIEGQIEAQELGFNSFQEAARLFAKRMVPHESREPESLLRTFAEEEVKEDQKESLRLFGVEFDTWFSEQSLHESGHVEALLRELQTKGVADDEPYRIKLVLTKKGIESIEREEQAAEDEDEHGETAAPIGVQGSGKTLWLRSTKFGDDMDRVLRRKDGRLTYISSDVAYHADKFNRPHNADKLITILGPDHHGYIARLHAVVAAFLEDPGATVEASGQPLSETEELIYSSPEERDACLRALELSKEKLEIVIFQIVRFLKDGKPAPMRKRDGNIYELRDLIVELGQAAAPAESEEEQMRVGRDVARFFYLMRSHDTHMDFDIDLATKQSDENPVFYAQYAHARICSVLRKAPPFSDQVSYERLTHPREGALIKKLLDLPFEVERSAQDYGVHRLTTYAVELARTYHHFYDACRVILPDDPELSKARVALCQATKITLKATFDLLGVSAPEKMERAISAPEM